jgi:hypothetical protein
MQEIKSFEERKNELVKLGKESGLITYEQLANALKGLDLDSDSLDELYNAFSENNIAVVSEDDNNVEFYISKELKEVGEESVSTIKVIVFISLIVLGIVILFVRKNLKNS